MIGNEEIQQQSDITQYSFEQALKELETIVQQLEQYEVNLEEAITKYKRADELRQHCERKLQEAKLTIDKITIKAENNSEVTIHHEEITENY